VAGYQAAGAALDVGQRAEAVPLQLENPVGVAEGGYFILSDTAATVCVGLCQANVASDRT